LIISSIAFTGEYSSRFNMPLNIFGVKPENAMALLSFFLYDIIESGG